MPTAPFTLEQAEESIADLRAQVDRMGEVHALDGSGGVVPNAQPNQAQLYTATDGQPAYVTPSGLAMGSVGAQQAFFPLNTVTNTLSLQSLASWTIPANDAAVGAVYEIEIWGNGTWSNTNTAVGAMGLQVVFGGNNMPATVTLGGAYMLLSSAFRFRLVGRVICVTTGAGGTWTSLLYGECSIFIGGSLLSSGASSANATNGFVACESTTTTPVDTTVNQVLGVSAAWGSATANGTITSRVAIAKRIC
jgi:hypothetical protein